MKNVEVIELNPIQVGHAQITIVGDSDLVLNKMDDPTARDLTDERKDRATSMEKPNEWEIIMTSLHWRDGKPKDFSEEGFKRALIENAPCISAFGLKKSFCQAVVRNGVDKYSTKFDAAVNVIAKGGLVPITFSEHRINEKLMSPVRGKPILARLNHFTGWSATFGIDYIETSYQIAQIVNIIRLAGFGLGIGSGRSSGFGRYHVSDVK